VVDKRSWLWLVGVCLIGGCLVFGSVPASAASTSKNRPTTTAVSSFKIAVSVGDIAHPVNYFLLLHSQGQGQGKAEEGGDEAAVQEAAQEVQEGPHSCLLPR
jgi:hypothetical protein